MTSSGHLSYIYLGKEMNTKTISPDTIVAYEPLSNHGDGSNVLFGDGHVEFVSPAAIRISKQRRRQISSPSSGPRQNNLSR